MLVSRKNASRTTVLNGVTILTTNSKIDPKRTNRIAIRLYKNGHEWEDDQSIVVYEFVTGNWQLQDSKYVE